jgi:hypothetical protein
LCFAALLIKDRSENQVNSYDEYATLNKYLTNKANLQKRILKKCNITMLNGVCGALLKECSKYTENSCSLLSTPPPALSPSESLSLL